jgi:hypothetical protein
MLGSPQRTSKRKVEDSNGEGNLVQSVSRDGPANVEWLKRRRSDEKGKQVVQDDEEEEEEEVEEQVNKEKAEVAAKNREDEVEEEEAEDEETEEVEEKEQEVEVVTPPRTEGERRYWLFKSEPALFSIDQLARKPNKTDHWDGGKLIRFLII